MRQIVTFQTNRITQITITLLMYKMRLYFQYARSKVNIRPLRGQTDGNYNTLIKIFLKLDIASHARHSPARSGFGVIE